MIVEFVGGKADGLVQDVPTDDLRLSYVLYDELCDEIYRYYGYLEESPETGEPVIAYLYEPMHYTIGEGSLQDGDFIT